MTIRTATMSGVDFVDGVPKAWGLSYRWQRNDGGRSKSKRPKQSMDCTVRALAVARRMDYDAAYDLLASSGRKCARGFHMAPWLNQQPWAEKMSFPAVKGQKRMNPAKFCRAYPQGVFICKVAKHVFTVVNGVVQDDFENAPDRCIYNAWKVSE